MRQRSLSLLCFTRLIYLLIITSCSFPAATPTTVESTSVFIPTSLVSKITLTSQVPTPAPIPARAAYTLNTTIDYDRHLVTVDETIIYPNHIGTTLNSLTLAIAANLWANCYKLKQITVDNLAIKDFTLNAHQLDIPLQTPLAPDSVLTINLSYSLSLPYMDQANNERLG